MSATNVQKNQSFTGTNNHSGLRVARLKVVPIPFNSADLNIASVSATAVFGYLLALISVAVIPLTGQSPWLLLTVPVALAVVLFLPGRLNINR